MLSNYLNQTVEHQKKTDTDARGQAVYGETMMIKCRKQSKMQYITLSDGTSIKANLIYYTKDRINEGDQLDRKIIKAVDTWVSLNGGTVGYKAVVE